MAANLVPEPTGLVVIGLGLLAFAGVLLASQRSRLAQSLFFERRNRRRHLLLGAIVAMALLACSVAVYLADIGDDHVGTGALMVYNVAGLLSLLSAVVLTIAGLRTRDPASATASR